MTPFQSFVRRAYRLRPIGPQASDHVAQLRIEGPKTGRTLLLPYSSGLGYFIVPAGRGGLEIDTPDFRVEALDLLSALWARLRLALLFKKKKYLAFDDFSVLCYGPKPERKRFTTFNQHMFNHGVALDGDVIATHPELLEGWDDETVPAGRRDWPAGPHPVAIVVHVYYEETWGDIAGVLRRLAVPFDLIVTTVPDRARLIEEIRHEYPGADIEVMENRGRDVRPFLTLLERGRLDRYHYVCKVHGKKSSDGGRKSYMGSLWRRRLLFDLLAGPGLAPWILDRFERDPSVGMIGPRVFRLPSDAYSEELSWSVNKEQVLKLAEKMGIPPDQFRLDFFGGTMFWVRPEALAPLRKLRLSGEFPEERGLLDGGLEHAAERLFGASVVAAGYRLANIDGYDAAVEEQGAACPEERRPTGLG